MIEKVFKVTFGELASGNTNGKAQKWEDEHWKELFKKDGGNGYDNIEKFEFTDSFTWLKPVIGDLNEILKGYSGNEYSEKKLEIYVRILNALADKPAEDKMGKVMNKAEVIRKMADFFDNSYGEKDPKAQDKPMFKKRKDDEKVSVEMFKEYGDYIIPENTPALKEALTQILRYVALAYKYKFDEKKFNSKSEETNTHHAVTLTVTFND